MKILRQAAFWNASVESTPLTCNRPIQNGSGVARKVAILLKARNVAGVRSTALNRQLRVEKFESPAQASSRCTVNAQVFMNYQCRTTASVYALPAKSITDELMTGCTNFCVQRKPGTGKNHLAAAIGNRLLKDGQTVIVVTG